MTKDSTQHDYRRRAFRRPTEALAATKDEKRTPPPGRPASDRSLGWMTKTKGMVPVNLMSDTYLLSSINILRRNIVAAKLQSGQTSLSLLSLRYMEEEANDRGLNHEDTS